MSDNQLKRRDQVALEDTWDLTMMFEDDQAWEEAYEELAGQLPRLADFQGSLGESAESLVQALDQINETARQVSLVYVYAHLKNDQDTGDATYQAMYARAVQLYQKLSEVTAYVQPEVLAIPEETLQAMVESNERLDFYRHYLEDMTRYRAHTLSLPEEELLAKAGEALRASGETYSRLNNADLTFPSIKDAQGQEVQLTHGNYIKMLESSDRRVRQEAFEAFSGVYDSFKNTLASTLTGQVKTGNFNANVRHYDSARQAALFGNAVPESVYDTLVEATNERLNLLHDYVALRKELLEVDQLEMYDMYTPILGEAPISFTYEEAQAVALEALAPMGEDYVKIVQQAFDERWIDVYENKGKRSGAYSSGSYDSQPYILMNWQDSLDSLYTLVHELGHSVHSYLTNKNQEYTYSHYPIFLAEIASTTNENLVTHYLLNKYPDRETQLYILNHFLDGMKGTMFRQTQFAEFEHLIYQADAQGTPLTAEYLCDSYRELNAKYYGPAVNSDSLIEVEWARIPHFYFNYYVFQYATGFAASVAFSQAILEEGPQALERYLTFLKAGNSADPIDIMKAAGLDMTQATYMHEAFDLFEERLELFQELLHNQ